MDKQTDKQTNKQNKTINKSLCQEKNYRNYLAKIKQTFRTSLPLRNFQRNTEVIFR